MKNISITVDLNRKCPECGKAGACDNGICLECTSKAFDPAAKMRSAAGRAVQDRINEIHAKPTPRRRRWGQK